MTNWFFMKIGDDDHVYYEDGTKHPLTPHHHTLTFGKHKGTTLGDFDDRGYLGWLQTKAEENKDWFLAKTVTMRLNQLQ